MTLLKNPKAILFSCAILLAPLFFFFIGIPLSIEKDSAGYDAYATNMVLGHGYSINGSTFSTLREPGYPFFVSVIYKVFGVHNFFAVFAVQTILLGLLGILVYRLFARWGKEYVGLIAGLATSTLPSYGLYAHIMGTELLYTFILGLIFYLTLRVAIQKGSSPWYVYVLLGLLLGCGTLVRVQLILFLPFLLVCYVLFFGFLVKETALKILAGCFIFLVVIGSWMLYVHRNTGQYAITTGRAELALYTRAVRAKLSYSDISKYGFEWIKRSIVGGYDPTFLYNNEYHKLQLDYGAMATTAAAVATIKKQSIATVLHNPGHYLYGNLIEVIKLTWIEHDYSDFLNRNVRAGMYVLVYGLFLFGIVQLWRKGCASGLAQASMLALLFIAYNILSLTPFDTIPRYNTPYLFFYLFIGFVGITLCWGERIWYTSTPPEA